LEVGDPRADRFHHAGGFASQAAGKRQLVHAPTVIDVDKVDAHAVVTNQGLAWTRCSQRDLLP
jgi:hypothetical protein